MVLISLDKIKPGQKAIVVKLLSTGSMRRRLLDIGLIPGAEIRCLMRSPAHDPTAFLIREAVIAIRSKDCKDIIVSI